VTLCTAICGEEAADFQAKSPPRKKSEHQQVDRALINHPLILYQHHLNQTNLEARLSFPGLYFTLYFTAQISRLVFSSPTQLRSSVLYSQGMYRTSYICRLDARSGAINTRWWMRCMMRSGLELLDQVGVRAYLTLR
jgi:hypothetical protein